MPPSKHHVASRRIEVTDKDREREVFRFVRAATPNDRALVADFLSDAARGKRARGRSAALTGHMGGMSAFRTLALARERWRDIAALARRRRPNEPIRVGEHIARVMLRAGNGFAYEDLGHPDGHLTIWGAPNDLAGSVVEIVPAEL
jgi:hypothetical protein